MRNNILVVTHERSGTHLLINIINSENNGNFRSIGKLPNNIEHNLENYKNYVYKHIVNTFYPNIISKSHHQVEFYESFMDYLFDNYKVIYVKRDIKDVLVSYYHFLKRGDDFPEFKDWIFMNPKEIGNKYVDENPDPHIIIEPKNHIDRINLHYNGWMKYKDKLLVVSYEDLLNDFSIQKEKLEDYLGKKVSDKLPDKNDKKLPNIKPNKGIIGWYKEFMDDELMEKINR